MCVDNDKKGHAIEHFISSILCNARTGDSGCALKGKKKKKSNAFGQQGAAIHKTCYENICVIVYFKVQINGGSINEEWGRIQLRKKQGQMETNVLLVKKNAQARRGHLQSVKKRMAETRRTSSIDAGWTSGGELGERLYIEFQRHKQDWSEREGRAPYS